MNEHSAADINRIGNTIANVYNEINNQTESVCARLDRINENLGYIETAIDLSNLMGIEDALERIAYALERANEWENISRPTLAKSS
jgi:regulator of sigma D